MSWSQPARLDLAEVGLTIAIHEWLGRFPNFEMVDPLAVTFAAGQVRGPRRIPLASPSPATPPPPGGGSGVM